MINIPVPPWRRDFDCARDPYTARNALGIVDVAAGAPTSAEYITSSADATLTNERVLTNTATITWDFSTPGQAKASTTGGGGNVSNSGTPATGQLARWVTSTTIEGVSLATAGIQPLDATLTALAAYNTNGLLTQTAADTFTGRTLTGPAAGITVSNGDGVAGNPTLALANDLAALEGLSGTNTIPYRSGTDTWAGVTVGTGLSFSGGTLSATASTAFSAPQGRLTLTSGVPVLQSDAVSQQTIYYTPFVGDLVPIYNGTSWTMTRFTELTLAMAGSANFPAGAILDLFVVNDAGTIRLGTGPAWSSATVRGTGAGTTELQLLNGLWVNKNSITLRYGASSTVSISANQATYVGSVAMNANGTTNMVFKPAAASGGTNNLLSLYNAYNRQRVMALCRTSTASWTVTSTTPQAFDAGTGSAFRVNFLDGLGQSFIFTSMYFYGNQATAGAVIIAGVALDSTTTAPLQPALHNTTFNIGVSNCNDFFRGQTGWHFISGIQYVTSSTGNLFGAANSGMTIALDM